MNVTKRRTSTTVAKVAAAMDRIAPAWAAEEWDNVGLLAGGDAWPARRVLLTIDLTPAVLAEARKDRVDMVIAYHPPIFRPLKSMLVGRRDQASIAAEAVARRIAIYSPHTALDAAPGGTNDALADLCKLVDVKPAAPAGADGRQCKLVVFVPPENIEQVAEAVFQAGAGRIGDYEKCGFRLRGQGTFFGMEGADPVVGRKGRLETVDEIRMETVFPRRRLASVVQAIRRSHPYEEPAFDVYPLSAAPDRRTGQGRIGRFAKPTRLATLARMLVHKTKAACPTVVGAGGSVLRQCLVWAGAAGGSSFDTAVGSLGEGGVIVTGEIHHHDALRLARLGVAAVGLGHWASERPVLRPLRDALGRALPGVRLAVSVADCDPLQAI